MPAIKIDEFEATLNNHEQVMKRARAYVDAIPAASEPGRNNAAYKLAAQLREKFDLNDADRLEVIRAWNARCTPPLDDEELLDVVRNPDKYAKKAAGSGATSSKKQKTTATSRVTDEKLSLNIIRADQIKEEELTWFWENRIPEGMYSFIVGDPGSGKTFLSCYLAAIASTGGVWGDGTPFGSPVDVLMFVSEDHLSKTFKKRLRDAGTDMSRIHICQWIESKTKSEIPFVIQQNIDVLKEYLTKNPQIKLVSLDPITGYMGGANQNSQADVRAALIPVKNLAETMNVTIIGFSHLNKKVDLNMQHRSIGSIAFNAVPRAVWGVFAKDDEEGFETETNRFFFPIKDNICINPDAMKFNIVDNAVSFCGNLSRQEMAKQMSPTTQTKKEQAKELILNALKDGELDSESLIQVVTNAGVSERTATNARKELRSSKKIDLHNPEGKGFKWYLL